MEHLRTLELGQTFDAALMLFAVLGYQTTNDDVMAEVATLRHCGCVRPGPLVSIVTPCLNSGEWLARCLDSIAAQTYPRIEHLVIDGGSTDGTIDLLHERGIQFVSEPDRGQTEAINKGFALAHGQWLGWLNADDVLFPRAIELAVGAVESAPGVGWVYGDSDMRQDGRRHLFLKPPAHVDGHVLEAGNCIPQPGTLIARWALERVGALDEDLHLAMDFDLWLRLVDAGAPSVYVPETLSVYELHDASKSGSVHRSEFLLEMATALLKSGRRRSSAFALGRAAVSAARRDGDRIAPVRLEREIAWAVDRAARVTTDIDMRALRAGAYAEAALLGLYARPRSVRLLLRPEPWLARETRTDLFEALALGAFRRLTRR